jgi:SulP family sulfate permease
MRALLPSYPWLKTYSKPDFFKDLSAGLIVAVMLVPQGMAYAMLAGLPPVIGLYASTIPILIYALLGSSRQLAVGPVAIVSLMTLTGVSAVAEPGSSEFIVLAAVLALMVGVMQLLLGVLRVGFVVNFLSHAVISGFTSAAAIIIGLSQLKHLLGVSTPRTHNVFELLWETGKRLGDVNPITLLIGVGSIVALLLLKRLGRYFPAPLVVVVASTALVYFFNVQERGVNIVGDVPPGLPGFALPAFDMGVLQALLGVALAVTFVSFMESIAVAQAIANREGYRVDANQELVGLGLANVAAGVFAGYPVTGGFSRTAVNYQAGARSPIASFITAVLIMLTLVFFTQLFYYLPQAVLAAIIMVAVYKLINVQEAVHLFKLKPIDGWTLVITFVATLSLGIEIGIAIGAGFSLLVFIWRSAYPHTATVGYLPDEGVFRNLERYPSAQTFQDTIIIRPDASLYFANSAFLENYLLNAVEPSTKWVILDFSGVNDIDGVAIETLEKLMHAWQDVGREVYIAAMKGPVRDLASKAGWFDAFPGKLEHLSVKHVLTELDLWDTMQPAPSRDNDGSPSAGVQPLTRPAKSS